MQLNVISFDFSGKHQTVQLKLNIWHALNTIDGDGKYICTSYKSTGNIYAISFSSDNARALHWKQEMTHMLRLHLKPFRSLFFLYSFVVWMEEMWGAI